MSSTLVCQQIQHSPWKSTVDPAQVADGRQLLAEAAADDGTLEGQYIIKNIVIGAAMVVAATVRGGHLVPEPGASQPAGSTAPPPRA